jgi:hypothetical protein
VDREHYWLLANALATQPNSETKYELLLELCRILKADNPKFDPEKFLDASERSTP